MERVQWESYQRERMSLLDWDKKLERQLQPHHHSHSGKRLKEREGGPLPQTDQGATSRGGGGEGSSFSSYRLGSGLIMCTEFAQDQVQDDNFTDISIICSDGYAQAHRCLLIGSSPFLRDILIDKDMVDTSAISLPDVSVRHLIQVLSLLYTGRSVIKKWDEAAVFSLMLMLQLPVHHLDCRSAKESDFQERTTLRYYTQDTEQALSQAGDNLTQKGVESVEKGSKGLESGPSQPPPPPTEETLNEGGLEEDNVENEDPVGKQSEDAESTVGIVNGRGMPVDSTTSKDGISQQFERKRKSVGSDDGDKPEKEDEGDDGPKEGIYHRLRKRPMTMKGAQALIMKKKAVAKLRKKSTVNNQSEESEASAADIGKESKDEEEKGTQDCSIPSPSSSSVLSPGIILDRERRLSSVSSVSSATSSSGMTTGSAGGGGASRVFLETKEISGISYNIYGLLDPVKGVQSGKTIAIIASKDKSSSVKKCEELSGKIS